MPIDEQASYDKLATQAIRQHLRGIVARVIVLDEQIKALNAEKTTFYVEAKALGLSKKMLRAVVDRLRREKTGGPEAVEHDSAMFNEYLRAARGGDE